MKKTILSIFVLSSLLFAFPGISSVQAETLREARKDVLEAKRNLVEERKDFREDVRERVASKVAAVKAMFKARISFGSGKLTAISGTTLTVEKNGKSYTVLTGTFEKCTTQFRRRFWGSSALAEFTVGDSVNVAGRFQNEEKTIIEACVVRDISIQKRFGVFVGEVTSLLSNGWVMNTVGEKRADQTVTVSSSTKYTNRKEQPIVKTDIKVGDRVRVKGLWNSSNNTVTEVKHVKDYSLPVVPSASVTATPTVTATVSPTVSVTATVTATLTATPTP